MKIQELLEAFTNAPSHEMKVKLYELIKAEQVKQEQTALEVIYGSKGSN
jgi:hypothetical protein